MSVNPLQYANFIFGSFCQVRVNRFMSSHVAHGPLVLCFKRQNFAPHCSCQTMFEMYFQSVRQISTQREKFDLSFYEG